MALSRSRFLAKVLDIVGPFLGLAVVLAIFSWLSYEPDRPFVYLSANNIKQVAVQTTILATCGIGMTLVIIAGGIDLSIGSIVALANVTVVLVLNGEFVDRLRREMFGNNDTYAWTTAAILSAGVIALSYYRTRRFLVPLAWLAGSWLVAWLVFSSSGAVAAFCAGTLVGLACGWLNGVLITSTGVVPFIITLGTMEIFRGATFLIANNTKVDVTPDVRRSLGHEYAWLDQLMTQRPNPEWMIVGPGVWLMAVVAVLTILLLTRMRLGRYIFAIGSNEEAGRLSGLAVPQIKRWVYGLSGLAAGVAGVMQFSRLSTAAPGDDVGLELDVIAAVVIGGGSLRGGRGSIIGTLIGAFILSFMRSGCTLAGIENDAQRMLIGSIIVLAVMLDEWRHGKQRS